MKAKRISNPFRKGNQAARKTSLSDSPDGAFTLFQWNASCLWEKRRTNLTIYLVEPYRI